MTSEKSDLLTWYDIERRIAQCTNGLLTMPAPIRSVSVYSDSVELYVASDDRPAIKDVLTDWFSQAELDVVNSAFRIILKIGDSEIPIVFSEEQGVWTKPAQLLPLWKRLAYLSDAGPEALKPPRPFPPGPVMSAFHSFKGGVGRTTSLVAFATARLTQSSTQKTTRRMLIVDADTEAPGITYWLAPSQRGTVSYVRLLEALHSPPTDELGVLSYFAKEIRKTVVELDGHQVYVLPAFVDQTDLLNAKISPEFLVKSPDDPWTLGSNLQRLGNLLEVEHVFVDLRAGLSELSSPLLFDSRFHRFIVTTTAEQSVRGVELLLHTLRQVWNSLDNRAGARHPALIFSLLTDVMKGSKEYVDIRERLERAYSDLKPVSAGAESADETGAEVLESLLETFESTFSADLMAFRDFEHAFSSLKRSSLIEGANRWFQANSTEDTNASPQITSVAQLDEQARSLAEICKAKQFAETQDPGGLLATEALRNLGRAFSEEVPNAVLIGAKGSGKTFSYLQISYSRQWSDFLKKIAIDSALQSEICVFPLLRSNELGNNNASFIDEGVTEIQNKFKGNASFTASSMKPSEIKDKIDQELANQKNTLADWVKVWTSMMGRAIGSAATSLSELNSFVSRSDLSVVFLFDGIEDVLRDVETSEAQKLAVEAIIELPNRIRELRDPCIGVLAFVREDYAKAVKTQNLGQFQSRYQKFRLDWSPREFLQLILWLCSEAKIEWAENANIDGMETESLVTLLENLWGRKLGRDDAAEAYSARWVYAALSDLKGRLQARDAVRFLGNAAQQATGKRLAAWNDRVLPPNALRGALLPTSQEKVKEAVQEYAPLRIWVDKLNNIDPSKKKIPFSAEELELDGNLRQSLQEIGVIYEDSEKVEAERLYVPEIYRNGLRLAPSAGARPRVQALLQRALGTLPF